MAGYLDDLMNPANQGILNLAAGLLQAGGPSRMPVSFGQALGQGLQQGVGAFQGAQQAAQQADLLKMHSNLYSAQAAELAEKIRRQQMINGALANMPSTPSVGPVQLAGPAPIGGMAPVGGGMPQSPQVGRGDAIRNVGENVLRAGAITEGKGLTKGRP